MVPAWIRIGSGNHSRKPVVGSIHGVGLGVVKTDWLVEVAVGGALFVGVTNSDVKVVSIAIIGV